MGEGLLLCFDEYNPDLALDHFVVAGVAVQDGEPADKAAQGFEALAGKFDGFDKKARKWSAEQFQVFAEYLLGEKLIPVAWHVALDDTLREALSAYAKESRDPSNPGPAFRRGQWLIGLVFSQALITGCVHWVLRVGPIDRMSVVMDHGNLKPRQEDGIKSAVAELTGEACLDEIRATPAMRELGIVSDETLPQLERRCVWPPPSMSFEKSHPLLCVADGYAALVSKCLNGDAGCVQAMTRLDSVYSERHRTYNAPFLHSDGTKIITDFLGTL